MDKEGGKDELSLTASTSKPDFPADSSPRSSHGDDTKTEQADVHQDRREGHDKVWEDADEVVVDWEGPDDPAYPKKYVLVSHPLRTNIPPLTLFPQLTKARKWKVVSSVALLTFISPVTSSIGAPGRTQIAEQFGITSPSIIAMTTSVFVLAYAFNIACGFAQSTGQLIGFRFLAGLGGSAPLAIGGGVLSDCFRPEERGRAISIYSLAPVLGPALGPVAGAWVVDRSTWRWAYWGTSIVDAVILAVTFVTSEETYAPILLSRKAARTVKNWDHEKALLKVVRTPFRTEHRDLKKMISKALVRPFQFLLYEPIIQLFGLYMAFLYAMCYLILTTIPGIYSEIHHERIGIVGLHYLALGIGMVLTGQLTARGLDKFFMYFTRKNGGVMKPEYRLPCSVPGTIALPIGLLVVGWSAQERTHWIVPDIVCVSPLSPSLVSRLGPRLRRLRSRF
ncbi:hypothetical protein EWM64_g10283 [Hericium alpestre]|uniref:Major facilitator superfamily (MFS) profile domain-containing protein n=1 Tax=Hericium alpestre TaxID=135208 RepID=A0A4Y9ZHS2_9AGAM|nr:hypothetical protein EWM64_g10283 [Hericium alpestre]